MLDSWRFFANSLSEFLPIATFVFVSEMYGFMPGIKVLLITSTLCLLFSWLVEKRLPTFGLFASATILLFGCMSLYFDNPQFIIIKDSLYYLFFALVLLFGRLRGWSLLKIFFNDFFAMTDRGWNLLSYRWMIFFFVLTLGNEIARYLLVPETWVIYKFSALIATWIFGFYQFTLAKKERLPEASPWGLRLKVNKIKKVI